MTAPMAHYIGYLLKSPTILALHSRNYCDLNRRATAQKTVDGVLNTQIQKAAKKEYTSILTAILNEYTTLGVLNRPVLILSIHGMKDRLNRGIDIGSGMGKSANLEVAGWFQNALSQALLKQGIKTKIHLDDGFTGANQLKILRKPEYFGSNLHILQIEISRDLRINYFFQLTLILAQILKNFEKQDWTKISKLDNDIEELKLEIRIATNLSVKEVEMDASQRRRLKIKKNEQIELFAGTRKLGVFNVVAVERSRIGSGQVGVSENLMKHFGLVNKQILTLKKPNF